MVVDKVLKQKGSDILTVGVGDAVVDIARLFEQKRKGLAVVCDGDGRVTGVVSLGDIVHAVGERGADALNQPVREIMTVDVTTCEPGDNIETALDRMSARGIRHLPVVADGKPVGLIDKIGALEVLYEEAALDFAQLRNYVFKTGGRF